MLVAALVFGLAPPVTAQVSVPPTGGASQAELNAAKALAMQANTRADAAATAAAQAKSAADSAALTASTAASTASTAQTNAATAQAAITTAQTTASTAQTNATAAKVAADAAAATAATATANAATATASANTAAAAAAAACQPMAMVPPPEVPGGTTGSGQNCRLVNGANNRISRTGQFTISAGGAVLCAGSATCNWSDPLPSGFASYPIFFTAIGVTGSAGVKCKVTSTSSLGFVGATCVQSVASVSILGAAVEIAASTGTKIFALSLPATQANQ